MSIKAKQFQVILEQAVQSSQSLSIQGGKVFSSPVISMRYGVHSGAKGQRMFNPSKIKDVCKIVRECIQATNHIIVNFAKVTPKKLGMKGFST